jgi:hypothetical protein
MNKIGGRSRGYPRDPGESSAMIGRISQGGSSFKGLAAYLTHDAKANTDERIAWTHTLNLANDDIPSAVNEMLWTARDAELLKQEAGIQTFAGHSSLQVTMDRYGHLFKSDDHKKAMDAIGADMFG